MKEKKKPFTVIPMDINSKFIRKHYNLEEVDIVINSEEDEYET